MHRRSSNERQFLLRNSRQYGYYPPLYSEGENDGETEREINTEKGKDMRTDKVMELE